MSNKLPDKNLCESGNPESIENLGSRVALRLPGMTTSSHFQGSCKRLHSHLAFYEILGGCDFGEISNLKK
jgi:hypothetical protein